jgi:hypothetical protein
LSCDIRSDYYEVNLPADLNITMGCGNNNVWFEFYPNNNYNQRVYFTASNSKSSLSEYAQFLAGNTNQSSFYTPVFANITSDPGYFERGLGVFDALFPDTLSPSAQLKLVVMTIFLVVVVTMVLARKISTTSVVIGVIISLFFMFFFAYAGAITYVYPVLFFVLLQFGLLIRFLWRLV